MTPSPSAAPVALQTLAASRVRLPVLQALPGERNLHLRWLLRTHQHAHLKPHECGWLGREGAPLVQGEACEGARHARLPGKRPAAALCPTVAA